MESIKLMMLMYSMMYRNPAPFSKSKWKQMSFFMQGFLRELLTLMRREAERRGRRLYPEVKMWHRAFI
jgi:hypothetical protein